MKRYGIIMAGGSGTRFWPLSRKRLPKQFLNLTGRDRLVNETMDRLIPVIRKEDMFVVTNAAYAELTLATAAGRLQPDHILAEPAARNTAACIGYAATEILQKYGDGVMGIFASDHYIRDEAGFRGVLERAVSWIFSAASKIGSSVPITVISCSFAFFMAASSSTAPSAIIIHAASASAATASVFIFPITVTHAQPAGARPMAILRRSQQKGTVISRSKASPTFTAEKILLSSNSCTVISHSLLCLLQSKRPPDCYLCFPSSSSASWLSRRDISSEIL